MKRVPALVVLTATLLFLPSCTVPPIVFHEGLPAYAPPAGHIGGRLGYNYCWWNDADRPEQFDYFDIGARLGQASGNFAFEEGLAIVGPYMTGVNLGVGLREPGVMLRGTWMPLSFGEPFIQFNWPGWWQLALLAGTGYKDQGWGFSIGAHTSQMGIGPTGLVEYALPDFAVRLQASYTVPSPWADSSVQGNVWSAGITVEPHVRLRR